MGDGHNMSAEKQSLKDKLMAIILLETSKDYKEMDSDLVTECVDFLMELEGKEKLTKSEIEQRVNEIPFKGKVTAIGSHTKKKIRAKRLAVIAAILAVIVALFGMIAVASGDSFKDFFIRMGNAVYELIESGSINNDKITYIKPNETKTYTSVEELIKEEELEILYPTWLPENEKIVKVWYSDYGDLQEFNLQNSIPEHSILIRINKELLENINIDCKEKQIADYMVFYEENPQYLQANFVYNDNLYIVKSDTEDNLFRIIENLKEIN